MSGFQLPQPPKPKMMYEYDDVPIMPHKKTFYFFLSVQESWHDQSDKASANYYSILDYYNVIYNFDIVTIQ